MPNKKAAESAEIAASSAVNENLEVCALRNGATSLGLRSGWKKCQNPFFLGANDVVIYPNQVHLGQSIDVSE